MHGYQQMDQPRIQITGLDTKMKWVQKFQYLGIGPTKEGKPDTEKRRRTAMAIDAI